MNLCRLCPRECAAARPGHAADDPALPGFCHSALAPRIARAALHFWEEPVISGRRGSGAVFFSGCNLRCAFCQNYEISSLNRGREVSPGRLREIYFELIEQGAHNINLVTPSHYTQCVLDSLAEPLPVPVVWNSNGYEKVETLRRLEGKVQIYLPDFKYSSDELAVRYSSAPDYCRTARAAINEMFRQVGGFRLDDAGMLRSGLIVRHLILPGAVENSCGVIDRFAARFDPGEAMFSLMRQYFPCGRVGQGGFPELERRVSDEEYAAVLARLEASGIADGFVQDGASASAEYTPCFDGTGV